MDALTGTGALVRLALRRDRLRLPVWIVLVSLIVVVTPPSFAELFPTEAQRAAYAAGIAANPALLALQGPMFGADLGALTAGRSLSITSVLVALLAVLTVIRHTRAEEEAGRRELLGAGVVGRHAGLAAALVVAVGAVVLIAGVVTGGLIGGGLPVAGSVAFGAALGTTGALFAALAAVVAQLTETARAASGIALGALGLAFLLRASGDAGGTETLAGASPLGWVARVRPFTGEQWWVLGLAVGAGAALAVVAVVLAARRDLAAGALPPRPGPATGSLGGPFALAWRLQRGPLLGWTLAFAAAGAAFGGVAPGIGALVGQSPEIVDLLRALGGEGGLVDVFLAAEFGILGLLASAYAISAVLRLRTEETANRAETVLATSVGRGRWTASHLVVALLGPGVPLLAAGVTAGLTYGAAIGDLGQVGRLIGGTLVQLPAAWVLVGIALALFGVLPRAAGAVWGVLVAFLLLGDFGPLLRLPEWLLDVSPYAHLPRSLGVVDATPIAALVAVSAALIVVGLVGFRRRDVG